jgi:hypothetical protein
MDISDSIQVLAILIECAVAVIAMFIATRKNKTYGWFIAITFALFVIFDVDRIVLPTISSSLNSLFLLVACVSMLYAVWLIYRE